MKLLLDENLPKRLKNDFSEFHIFTISEKSWNGKTNGELLKLMIENNFDVLLTFDKNLQHQQNFNKYTVSILVLNSKDNSYQSMKKLVPKIKDTLSKKLIPGPIEIKE
ncbi:MAG: DUF5615 family PIN-like protein [Bacteroidetes bacterium]|nr:DUF5615 family PIN-like protein [Bacteroidota bacterium]